LRLPFFNDLSESDQQKRDRRDPPMAEVKPAAASAVAWIGATAVAVSLAGFGVPWLVILRFALLVVSFLLAGRYLAPRGLDGAAAVATALTVGMAAAALLWRRHCASECRLRFRSSRLPGSHWRALVHRRRASACARGARSPWRRSPASAAVAWTQFGNGSTPWATVCSSPTLTPARLLFHCAIASGDAPRPRRAFSAGSSLPYHVGYHLLGAITAEATGASMLDVNYRLLPIVLRVRRRDRRRRLRRIVGCDEEVPSGGAGLRAAARPAGAEQPERSSAKNKTRAPAAAAPSSHPTIRRSRGGDRGADTSTIGSSR